MGGHNDINVWSLSPLRASLIGKEWPQCSFEIQTGVDGNGNPIYERFQKKKFTGDAGGI